MVKIRYSELPAGLHVAAEADREGTVVYLQPGLTSAQRRAALTRVRSSARMGHGPMLPGHSMARAIAADRVRTNASIGAAAARRHPMLFLPPVTVLLVSALVFLFMSIQPLTVATQNVGSVVPTLRVGVSPLPSAHSQVQRLPQGHQRARAHRAAVLGPAQAGRVQSDVPASCASPQAPSSGKALLAPPTRANSRHVTRCLSHPQHWARTQRL